MIVSPFIKWSQSILSSDESLSVASTGFTSWALWRSLHNSCCFPCWNIGQFAIFDCHAFVLHADNLLHVWTGSWIDTVFLVLFWQCSYRQQGFTVRVDVSTSTRNHKLVSNSRKIPRKLSLVLAMATLFLVSREIRRKPTPLHHLYWYHCFCCRDSSSLQKKSLSISFLSSTFHGFTMVLNFLSSINGMVPIYAFRLVLTRLVCQFLMIVRGHKTEHRWYIIPFLTS